MSQPAWRPVKGVDFRKLHDARLHAHYAAQWLARFARAYIAPQPDDGHTSFRWDDTFNGLVTRSIPDGMRLGLNVAELSIAVLGDTGQTLSLDGRADAEVRAWLGRQLAGKDVDPRKLDAPSPYDMPSHVLALGARYSVDELTEPFRVLSTWYADASGLLGRLREKLAARKFKAPPVRCWPHHFDLDSPVAFSKKSGMALGFSPGDDYCDEPYFYVTIYPEPVIPLLPLLPPQGHWHSYEFVAALAPAHKIVVAADQGAYVEAFFDVAIKAALEAQS